MVKKGNIKELKKDVIVDLYEIGKSIGRIEECYEQTEYDRAKTVKISVFEILAITKKYDNFDYQYIQSDFNEYDDMYVDTELSEDDFYNANINEDNYGKADYIICDIVDKFLTYLKNL